LKKARQKLLLRWAMGVGTANGHNKQKFFAAAARVGLFYKKARAFFPFLCLEIFMRSLCP
jgi:hypothetical protein